MLLSMIVRRKDGKHVDLVNISSLIIGLRLYEGFEFVWDVRLGSTSVDCFDAKWHENIIDFNCFSFNDKLQNACQWYSKIVWHTKKGSLFWFSTLKIDNYRIYRSCKLISEKPMKLSFMIIPKWEPGFLCQARDNSIYSKYTRSKV